MWIVERQTELIEFGLVKLEEVVFILRVLVDRLWTNLAQVVLIDAVLSCRSFAAFLARRAGVIFTVVHAPMVRRALWR